MTLVTRAGKGSALTWAELDADINQGGADRNPTKAEIAAGVTIVQPWYQPMTVDRYGVNTTPGVTDMLPAINAAIAVTAQTDNGGGGTVDFLSSIYFHSAEIPLIKYVRLRGTSKIGTLLLSSHTGNGIVSVWGASTSTPVYTALENLSIKNTNASNTGAAYVNINGTYTQAKSCDFIGFKFGVIHDGGEVADYDWCNFNTNLTAGMWITNGADHTPTLTFTGSPAAGATSGTLTGNWLGYTGTYNIQFAETVGGAAESRTGTLTNGSTAVTWINGLTNACNAATTGSGVGFSNSVNIYGCNFLQAAGTGVAIYDDGGNGHTIQNCSFGGFANQLRSAGTSSLNVIGGIMDLGTAPCILFQNTSWNLGAAVGKSYGIGLIGVQFGPASGVAGISASGAAGACGQLTVNNCFFSTTVTPIVGGGGITSLDAMGNALSTPAQGFIDALPVAGTILQPGQILSTDSALAGFVEINGRQLKVVPIAGQTTAFLGGSAAVFGGDVVVNRGTGNNYLEVCNSTKSSVLAADAGNPFVGTMSAHTFVIRTNSAERILTDSTGHVSINVPTTAGPTLTLPAGTATIEPLLLTSGTNLTTALAGVVEYDGTCKYFSPAASSRAVDLAEYIQVLSASYTLTSQTAAQKLLNATTNGAVTLPVGTYEFECQFSLSSLDTTGSSFGFALGGTATFTQAWWALADKVALAAPSSPQMSFNTAANTSITTSDTTATGYAQITGIIRVTVAGTVIPQVSLTIASAAVVAANSFFRCRPVGNATVTNVGNWS
jgi:hypothetical protein